MLSKKYLGDYRLKNVTDKRGKIRTVPVYCGMWHEFVREPGELREGKRLFSVLTLAQIALLVMALFTNAPCSRVFYVMLPLAVLLLPLFFAAMGAAGLLSSGARVTNERNDHIRTRTKVCPVVMMILSGISALAHIPNAILYGETATDLVYLAAALGIFSTSLAQRRCADRFETREVENDEDVEEEPTAEK